MIWNLILALMMAFSGAQASDFDTFDPQTLRVQTEVVGSSTFTSYAKNIDASLAQPVWKIQRVTIAGNITQKEWASDKFDQIEEDKLTLFATPPFFNLNSILYTGTNDRHEFPNYVNALDFINGINPFTVSYWARSTKGGEQAIISKQAGSSMQGWRHTLQSGEARVHINGGGAGMRYEQRSPDLSLSDGFWHHICVACGTVETPATKCNMVIDGIDRTGASSINTDSFPVSGSADGSGLFKVGVRDTAALDVDAFLDEISIHDVQFSVANCQSLRDLGGTGKPGDLINSGPSPGDLILWLRQGDGDTFPNITNLGVAGAELSAVMTDQISSSIVGEVP